MSKIICDICGTSYPDSSDNCPICGCSNEASADLLNEEAQYEEFSEERTVPKSVVRETVRKKEIFDFDEVNSVPVREEEDDDEDEEYDEDEDDEDDDDEAPRRNTFVVILLTVLIVALLGAAGFIFFRYFMPNMVDEETLPATTAAVQEVETTAPSTEPTIPCQHMAMTNAGVANLNAEGQQFLLHIKALPENTTDKIIYTSGDESIATVTEDGKITAVSEGETIIYISCGKSSIECPVIVKYVEETVPATTVAEETTPAETGENQETVPAETDDNQETIPAETEAPVTPEGEDAATTEPTEGTGKDTTANKNVVLKLKKSDIQLGVYYQFQLVLDCALEPEEVTWTSEHPHIATVDDKGNVTAVKTGTTAIIAKYGDQEVQCIVRCVGF